MEISVFTFLCYPCTPNIYFNLYHISICLYVTNISLSFANQFLDVAALMDLLYFSRSSAVRPNLQTLAPIQSSTSFSYDLITIFTK